MSALGEAMGGDAPRDTFEHNGRIYKVRAFDVDAQLLYEKRVFRQARELLRETKEDYDAEEYSKQLMLQNMARQAGDFAFLSPRGQRFMDTNAGAQYIGAMLFQTDESDFQKLMLARGAEVAATISLVMAESFNLTPEQLEKAKKKALEQAANPTPTVPEELRLW